MTRSPGAWPRKSSSVHRKRCESTTAEGPCTPSGCQRAVGSGRYRSPSSRYLYRVPGATLAMVRVKTSSAPRVIGWGRRPSIATSTDRHRGAQTAKVTVSSRTLAPSTFIRSNEPPMGSAFALVLHTHLPMVLNHGRWPHGSDWLCEAAFECYLPLLETAHRLVADGISPKWTINLSPILTEQLASPEFQKELSFYYENVRRACVESRAHFEGGGNKEIVRLASFWEEFYERMWEMHRRIGGDIPGTFAELQRGGHVEMITCAATHGYLPLLSCDESIHLQLRTAVEAHKRHFGQAPRGIWLPECAYRPRYEWTPPTGPDRGRQRRMRPGLEEMLAQHKLEYFVADSHLVAAGQPVFLYRDYIPMRLEMSQEPAPMPSSTPRSPYHPYRVASRGGTGTATAFIRDPRSTLQVWSRDHGYPGEFHYLELHKKHFPGGFRFWRISDSSGALGRKQVYDPKIAAEKVGLQASHFVGVVKETIDANRDSIGALVCSPYDSELFGHWWFEGPMWLEHVAREMHRAGVQPMTLGESMKAVQPQGPLTLPEGSWGEGGDHLF